jgi:hypothetical protein
LVKNPPSATFVKQANLANGPQQVNNNQLSRPEENESRRNELLGNVDEKQLEPGSSASAGRRNSEMAAMAKIKRAKNFER